MSKTNSQHLQTLISEDASFEGKMIFEGATRVSGHVKGSIEGKGLLIIEDSAQVEADIEVDELILLGHLSGRILARKSVLMKPPARFSGEVSSPSLSIKEGVFFEGSSKKYQPS